MNEEMNNEDKYDGLNSDLYIPDKTIPTAIDDLIQHHPGSLVFSKQQKLLICKDVVTLFRINYKKYNIIFDRKEKVYIGKLNNFDTCAGDLLTKVFLDYIHRSSIFSNKDTTLYWNDTKKKFAIKTSNGKFTDIN